MQRLYYLLEFPDSKGLPGQAPSQLPRQGACPSLSSSRGERGAHLYGMLKKAVQQGRSERKGEAYASVR